MTAMELYQLLKNAGIEYEVVEIFEGARWLRIEVEEEDENQEIKLGATVYWTDPDEGVSSGKYKVIGIHTESGEVEDGEDIVLIANDHSEAQVYAQELKVEEDETEDTPA